jgi:hypothetical protein
MKGLGTTSYCSIMATFSFNITFPPHLTKGQGEVLQLLIEECNVQLPQVQISKLNKK